MNELTADPARLRGALDQADTATLLLVLVQFTGESHWLEKARPFITGPMSYQEKMPPALRQAIRARLFEVLMQHATSGAALPPLPEGDLLHQMLSIAAGEPLGEEYVRMMREELSPTPEEPPLFDPASASAFAPVSSHAAASSAPPFSASAVAPSVPRAFTTESSPGLETPAGFRVLIIGAGMSGLCAAIRLKQAGVSFSIIEKNGAVGGTWYENSYPGCGVDTPNHFYSYSFAPYHEWSMLFAKRRELWDYFERVADDYGIREHVRFNTEVESAVFDEATNLWRVVAKPVVVQPGGASSGDAAGLGETPGLAGTPGLTGAAGPSPNRLELTANVVISCVGVLNRPQIPQIPGLAEFAGPTFHTAQWDPTFDWRGKKIAMIGTGASGHQVGPTIAPDVERLTIFQRSPHWIVPNPNYFEQVPDGVKWLLAHLPYYVRWYRFQLFWGFSDGLYSALQIDPTWPNPERSINQFNERHRRFMERHMRAELGEDSPLLEKVLPHYPPYGKRILIDNHWYKMLKRPNVDLVTDPIKRVHADGIETQDGKRWPADALVFATGFQASKMLAPMTIEGRDGREIHRTWGPDDAKAYMGITVPGYPNFFILLGPNTGLAHGGNAIFMVECQVRQAMSCLRELVARRARTIEVRPDVSERYNEQVDSLHSGLVWTHPGVQSWYKNKQGRVFAISPWRLVEYWRMTSKFNSADYVFG